MSFSYSVKTELCNIEFSDAKNRQVCLLGILMFLRRFSLDEICLVTEHEETAQVFDTLLREVIDLDLPVNIASSSRKSGASSFTVCVNDRAACKNIICFYKELTKTNLDTLKCNFLEGDDEHTGAFLRGVYLVCGSITDPSKEYHFELSAPNKKLCTELYELLNSLGITVKQTVRAGNNILYLKESEPIEDFLTYIGAVESSLEIMNVKIVKDIRNKVNRQTNCEVANMKKTTSAVQKYAKDMEYVLKHESELNISEELIELAQLRIENEDVSLRELGKMLSKPITRSGVNHRIRKISDIAAEHREKRGIKL